MKTMLMVGDGLEISPPCWESALSFLDTLTYLNSEFGVVDLVSTGMFDLNHPETAQELDLEKNLRAIRYKSAQAKKIVQWIAENRGRLKDYPEHLREQETSMLCG